MSEEIKVFRGKFQAAETFNSNKPYCKSEWYKHYGLAYWNDKILERKGGNYWLNKK